MLGTYDFLLLHLKLQLKKNVETKKFHIDNA